jgi:uroporphyrinogen decarboxylase
MGMTSRERVLAAFAHEEPDRVPAWMGASPEFRDMARSQLGLDSDEALSVHVGDDFRRVYARFAGPESADPTHGLSREEATYRSPFGVERRGHGYGQPFDHPLQRAATLKEIHGYSWPDPAWIDPSGIRAQAAQWGGQYAILGGDWSPFFHDAIDLLGMETLLVKMYEQPELVDAVLAHIVDYYAGSSQRIFDAAADVIDIFFVGNDFGAQTGPIMGEVLFRRFMLPHLKRLVNLGHDYGLKVMMHCCGAYYPLIPLMIEIGIDGLQSLQPRTRDMEPARLKRAFGDRILLNGCIDTQHVLIEGTPELVRTKTREVLEVMKPGGGYVVSPSHDYLLPETPVANVLALYETVREYGGYHHATIRTGHTLAARCAGEVQALPRRRLA